MDGIEATRIIRSPESKVRNHEIPIVCISSHAVENKVHFCLAAGMQEYLEELSEKAVASAISRWAGK
jgi:CheY-like chemotaxis protein